MTKKNLTREQVEYFRDYKYTSAAGIVMSGFYRYFYAARNLGYSDIFILPMTEENERDATFESFSLNPWNPGYSKDETFPLSWSTRTGYLSDAGVTPAGNYLGNNFIVPLETVRDAYFHEAWKPKTPSVSADDILSIEVFRPYEAMGSWVTRVRYRFGGSVNTYSSTANN